MKNRWFQMVALVIAMVMIANLQYGWTLFVDPIELDHGWSLANIQWAFTLFILFQTWVQPLDGWLIDRLVPRVALREPVYFVTCGLAGLMIEWFLIGLTPWSNPDAPVVLMALFQVGMFSFWATVAYAPRLLLARDEPGRWARKAVIRFSVGYFALVYVAKEKKVHALDFRERACRQRVTER